MIHESGKGLDADCVSPNAVMEALAMGGSPDETGETTLGAMTKMNG